MAMHSDARSCRVCGFEPIAPPWGEDERTPTFEMCPCCGVEYGYEEATQHAARQWRRRWLESGAKWADKGTPHDGLDTTTRLARVLAACR